MSDRQEPNAGRGHAGRTTMLQLVQSLTREGLSERDVVSLVLQLVESGQVILTGNFRNTPLEKPSDEPKEVEAGR